MPGAFSKIEMNPVARHPSPFRPASAHRHPCHFSLFITNQASGAAPDR